MGDKKQTWLRWRNRVSEMVETTSVDNWINRGYGILSTLLLLINLAATAMYTFDYMELHHGPLLLATEAVTVAFFAVYYCLRVWTAP